METHDEPAAHKRHGNSAGTTVVLILLALILGAVGFAIYLRQSSSAFSEHLAGYLSRRDESFNTSVPFVVNKIRTLNRLETVVYSLDSVVEGDRSSPVFPDVLVGDKILLVVHGESIAGVDLSKLKPDEVRIDKNTRSIHVNLPPSEIFLTTLDNQHTRVYSRTTGLLVPQDANLESDTRAKAEVQLREAALKDGILDTARKNAQATVSTLLFGLGFQHVDVR